MKYSKIHYRWHYLEAIKVTFPRNSMLIPPPLMFYYNAEDSEHSNLKKEGKLIKMNIS